MLRGVGPRPGASMLDAMYRAEGGTLGSPARFFHLPNGMSMRRYWRLRDRGVGQKDSALSESAMNGMDVQGLMMSSNHSRCPPLPEVSTASTCVREMEEAEPGSTSRALHAVPIASSREAPGSRPTREASAAGQTNLRYEHSPFLKS